MKDKSLEGTVLASPVRSVKKAAAKKLVGKAEKTAPVASPKNARAISPKSEQRRQQKIKNKRESIIQAALGLFSQYGIHGASLDQVASLADVSKTNLLYYFSSKEELYVSVLRQLLDVWLLPLRGFSAEQEPLPAIAEYIRIKLELSRDHPAESRLFCLEIIQGAPFLLDELQEHLRPLVETKVQVIQVWIDSGKLAPVKPHHLIFSLWAATQHYADFRVQIDAVTGRTLNDPEFFDEVLENLQALILNGIRPRP